MIIFIKKFFLQTDKNPWNPDNSKTKINFIINHNENIKDSSYSIKKSPNIQVATMAGFIINLNNLYSIRQNLS